MSEMLAGLPDVIAAAASLLYDEARGNGNSDALASVKVHTALHREGYEWSDVEKRFVAKDVMTQGDVHTSGPLPGLTEAYAPGGKKKKKKDDPGTEPEDIDELAEEVAEKADAVAMDVPLLIRMLELAREEIKSDEPIHVLAERLTALAGDGPLTMDDYADIVEVLKYSPDQPRASNGEFGEGESPREAVAFKPTERMERAMAAQVRCGRKEQKVADEQERIISKAIGVPRTRDNSAFDNRNGKVGVEIKTMLSSKNGKITMSKAALSRKVAEAKKDRLKTFTVVADKRAGKTQYYVAKGVGSFRVSSMTPTTLAGIRELVHA